MKKIIIGIMACSLSLSAFAFGRDGDVDYLVNSYKEKLDEVKKSESKKEADKQKAISDAQGSIDNYQDSIKAYNKSIKKYEKKYLEPASRLCRCICRLPAQGLTGGIYGRSYRRCKNAPECNCFRLPAWYRSI